MSENAATFREEGLQAAAACVLQDRNRHYGDPEDNFRRIAALWTTYKEGTAFTELDVAVMSLLIKVARLISDPTHLDSLTDIMGYGACGYEIVKLGLEHGAGAEAMADLEELHRTILAHEAEHWRQEAVKAQAQVTELEADLRAARREVDDAAEYVDEMIPYVEEAAARGCDHEAGICNCSARWLLDELRTHPVVCECPYCTGEAVWPEEAERDYWQDKALQAEGIDQLEANEALAEELSEAARPDARWISDGGKDDDFLF